MPAGVVGWATPMIGVREVRRGWYALSTGDVGREKRINLMFCCSTRDESDGMGLGEHREKRAI